MPSADTPCNSPSIKSPKKPPRPDKAGRCNHRLRATVHEPDGPRQITVTGRQPCRTLTALVDAKGKGITALEISSWALRLGHYVWLLRHDHGLIIQTIREPHDGGDHGRYILHSRVEIDAEGGEA